MADTHESVRNLTEMLARLSEQNQRAGELGFENQFKNKQLAQQAAEMEDNRKARAAYMNEMINARRQQAFLPFQEKLLNEEQKMHPKWTLQQQVQDALHQMKPEYRSMSAFGYDPKFNPSQLDEAGNPLSNAGNGPQGQGVDILKSMGQFGQDIGLPNLNQNQMVGLEGLASGGPLGAEVSSVIQNKLMNNSSGVTPYAKARAQALQDRIGRPGIDENTQGAGSNLGF